MRNMPSRFSTVLTFGVLTGIFAGPAESAAAIADNVAGRVVLETGFESGQAIPETPQHQVTRERKRSGTSSLTGLVSTPNKACFLKIPVDGRARDSMHVRFFAWSDAGTNCAIWVRQGNERRRIGGNILKPRWQRIEGIYTFPRDGRCLLEIVVPSSHGAPAGRAWIDDLRVSVRPGGPPPPPWPDHPQSFPALVCDGAGTAWMALIERPDTRRLVRILRLANGRWKTQAILEPTPLTGIAPPVLAPLGKGCVAAFPVERDDRWRIAVAIIDDAADAESECLFIPCEGNANINPAIAVQEDASLVLWESNGGGSRTIRACRVERKGPGPVQVLSSARYNSYNPAIVTVDGTVCFAAWDSFRGDGADLYGARFRDDRWEQERRLTSDPRIERHPSLAAAGGMVWMAWQAQSYLRIGINNLSEQRVVVARLDGDALLAPKDLFRRVSDARSLLMRPRVLVDPTGRLVLTARRSIAVNAGWLPLAWTYAGETWTGPVTLLGEQGRWQPVPAAWTPAGGLAAVQFDDLPKRWTGQGVHPDWKSGIAVVPLPKAPDTTAADPMLEPLRMPETIFSLAEKRSLIAADLPRQRIEHAGKALTLYWGDFHDHTDLSVCVRSKNPPGHDLFANERDIEGIDFCALTDHGYNFDPPQWAYNGEQTRNNHDPGRFVTFLGQEWTSSRNPPGTPGKPNRYGHHNLVFLDPHYGRFFDSYDGNIPPASLWKALNVTEFLCIPHQLADWKGKGKGNPPTDWSFTNERLQPVAEIFQARESYEYHGCPRQAPQGAPFQGYYLQDAWSRGIVIGVIASPDHGGGKGKVGVWTGELTRRSIFDAVRARHTFGTSGAKMGLLFRAGDILMGDRVPRPSGTISFQVRAAALREIREVVIFRNNEIVHRTAPNEKTVDLTWTDRPPEAPVLWYYARIQAADDELAWSSPIWLVAGGEAPR